MAPSRKYLVAAAVLVGLAFAAPATGAVGVDGTWGERELVDPAGHHLNAISCPSRSFCATVDGDGNAFVRKHKRWIYYANIDPRAGGILTSVSCPSSGFCAALDGIGNATTYNGNRWSRIVPLGMTRAVRVTCPSRTFCLAANNFGYGAYYDGSTWSDPVQIDSAASDGSLFDVSCGARDFCAAVDYHGNATMYDGATWSDPIPVDVGHFGPDFIACTPSRFCLAADEFGYVLTFEHGAWSAPYRLVQNEQLNRISCSSATFCMALTYSNYFTFDGTAWTGPMPAPPDIGALSCVTRAFCSATVSGAYVSNYSND